MSDTVQGNQTYDTSVNIMGSIKDLDTIISLIRAILYPNTHDINKIRQELDVRTQKSITRIENGVKKAFLTFQNEEHQEFIRKLLVKDLSKSDMIFILYWQFLVSNPLFREITEGVFVKYYFDGRAYITSDDILGYVSELKREHQSIDWSESTLKTIANKYLNLMSKLGFVKKEGRKLAYTHITIPPSLQVLLLYFSMFYPNARSNSLSYDLAKLSFMPQDDLVHRYKELSKDGLFDMSYNGETIGVDFNDNIESIIDALFK